MTIKFILTVALITPLLTVSSMAQQYVGGPKSGIGPHDPANRQRRRCLRAGRHLRAGRQSQQKPRLSRWPEDCHSAQ